MTGRASNPNTRETQEQTMVLNIDLTRGLVAVLLMVAIVVVATLLVRGPAPASAAGEAVSAATDNMRRYYLGLTKSANDVIDDGCVPGYHFASLWEILDPSNLVFESALSVTRTDVGDGPPTGLVGWVRTGYSSDFGTVVGRANCSAWTSVVDGEYGTTAQLPADWLTGGELHVWDVGIRNCSSGAYVWCVED